MRKKLKLTALCLAVIMLLGTLCSCGEIKIPTLVDDWINFDDSNFLDNEDESEKESKDDKPLDGDDGDRESESQNGDAIIDGEPDAPTDPSEYRERILLVTDFHYVSTKNWYETDPDERMRLMIEDINEEYKKDPFCMIVFMGDYSLDHWAWDRSKPYCTYLNTGVSHTELFMKKYKSQLPDVPMFWLAGNHEQFGEATWKKMVGNSRQGYEIIQDYMLIMWDSYGGELDPDYHHDGVYTPIDTKWVRSLMDKYPDKKVILISHFFDAAKEKGNSEELLKDDRVIALFGGHNHASHLQDLGGEFGHKYLAFAGNYSYYNEKAGTPDPYYWGFRDLVLTKNRMRSAYLVCENTITVNGKKINIAAKEQNILSLPT